GIFYNRVKGELEDALRALAFPNGIVIAHPSMLLGARAESRAAESIGKAVMRGTGFLMAGPLRKYKAIEAVDVARAM
ncbi:nucleoside-diphosphate sugar epimerase, partial [Pseudomonas sp. FW300-N1A5]